MAKRAAQSKATREKTRASAGDERRASKEKKRASPKVATEPVERTDGPLAVVERVFKAAKWSYARAGKDPVQFRIEVEEDGALGRVEAELHLDTSRFVLYFVHRDRVPEKRRAEVAAYVARANYGLLTGNYELDLETGLLRFKTSIDFTDTELAPYLVRNMILHAIDATEVYDAGVEQVARGKVDAKKAIAAIES